MMRSRYISLIAEAALALTAAGAFAQPLAVPPGQWWERPRLNQALGLSAEQTAKLDAVAIEHARTMVDLKAAVEKAELDVRAAAEAEPFDPAPVRAAFARLQQARTRLETERFELLLAERGVLTTDQWHKLRALARQFMEQRREERRPDEGAPEGRRPLPPRRF
jgi:Spy/CpxP family protein refolding chaperone